MARHIPPRRVPRDRFVFSQGSGSAGGIFGGASIPGAHTHLEVDITDLDKFSQAAADARFLKLDASNDPMTAQLEVPSILSDFVQFDIGFAGTAAEGKLKWNTEDGTLEVGLPGGVVNLQIGQELVIRVRNNTGVTITNGSVIRITGASGNKPLIALADATNESTASVLGITTEDIADNSNGFVTISGLVRDVDTSGMVEGDLICLASTPGDFQNTRPIPPIRVVRVGHVIAVSATVGVIHVAIEQHFGLDHEISDVLIASIVTNELLQWTGSVWENKTLGEAGISALGHTHLEVDITDLDKYTQAAADAKFVDVAGDIMTGDLEVFSTLPRLILHETDGSVNQKRWDFRVQGDVFTMRAVDDANTVSNDVFAVVRSGIVVDRFNVKATQLQHNLVDVSLVGHTHLEADITDLRDYLLTAGGTLTGNLTLILTNPTYSWEETDAAVDNKKWDMRANSGIMFFRALNDAGSVAGTYMRVDRTGTTIDSVDFPTGLTFGGTAVSVVGHTHLEADITDLKAYLQLVGGTMTGELKINVQANAISKLTIGEPTTLRGNTQDGFIELFGENAGAIGGIRLQHTGASFRISDIGGSTNIQLTPFSFVEVLSGKSFRIRDATNADIAAWTHDGTDFNLAMTNTTDYNITGANLKLGAGLGVNGVVPVTTQTVTGSRGGNAALASLLTAIANYGLITDSSTA